MAQGLMYSVLMDAQVVTVAKDLISIEMPPDVVGILHEVNVTQEASETSDTGVIQIHRASGTAGAGTNTVARALQESNSVVFTAGGAVADVMTDLTTPETEGNILVRRAWNVLTPFKWLPTPGGQILVGGNSLIVIRSDITITSATLTAEAIIERLG